MTTADKVKEFSTGVGFPNGLATDPDGNLLLVDTSPQRIRTIFDSNDRQLVMWDVGAESEVWRRPGGPVLGLDPFSPGGTLVALGMSRSILLLDARTGKVRKEIALPHDAAMQVSFSPDGEKLVYARGGASAVVDRRTGEIVRIHDSCFIGFSESGKLLLGTRTRFPKAIVRDVGSGQTTAFPGSWQVWPLAAPDSRRFVVTGEFGTAVFRLGALDDPFLLGGRGSHPLGWSHDGTRIVTYHSDRSVRIWDAATSEQ
jgi:WD40 repeat protein